MQVFRLVDGGVPDKLIAFDSLPARFLKGIGTSITNGIGKHWKTFAPEMFVLEYKLINNDIEKWGEICTFVRRTVDKKERLLDKLEDMAVRMSPDSKREVSIDTEDVPVIKIPDEFQEQNVLVPPSLLDKKTEVKLGFECPVCMKTYKSEVVLKQHAGREHKSQLAKEKVA